MRCGARRRRWGRGPCSTACMAVARITRIRWVAFVWRVVVSTSAATARWSRRGRSRAHPPQGPIPPGYLLRRTNCLDQELLRTRSPTAATHGCWRVPLIPSQVRGDRRRDGTPRNGTVDARAVGTFGAELSYPHTCTRRFRIPARSGERQLTRSVGSSIGQSERTDVMWFQVADCDAREVSGRVCSSE